MTAGRELFPIPPYTWLACCEPLLHVAQANTWGASWHLGVLFFFFFSGGEKHSENRKGRTPFSSHFFPYPHPTQPGNLKPGCHGDKKIRLPLTTGNNLGKTLTTLQLLRDAHLVGYSKQGMTWKIISSQTETGMQDNDCLKKSRLR